MLYTVAGQRRQVVAIDAASGETLWTLREPGTMRYLRSPRTDFGKEVAYADVDGRGVGDALRDPAERVLRGQLLPVVENTRLKKLLAESVLENEVTREALQKSGDRPRPTGVVTPKWPPRDVFHPHQESRTIDR